MQLPYDYVCLCLTFPLSLSTFISVMSTYRFQCWCMNTASSAVTSVEISPSKTISDLKQSIAVAFGWGNDVPAFAALLWKVSIPTTDFESYISEGNWKSLNHKSPEYLLPITSIKTAVPQPPEDDHLHIIVMPPRPKLPSKFISMLLSSDVF